MVLQTMLQRLFAAVMKGPGLNARPHSSRQRIDWLDLNHLGGNNLESALGILLEQGTLEIPYQLAKAAWPSGPMSEWQSEERSAFEAWKLQNALIKKVQHIATDAQDYVNDHGENALAIGFPLISIPKGNPKGAFGSARVLAPAALVPVQLKIRTGARPGLTLTLAGEGEDLLVPNPSLLAYLERHTGKALVFEEAETEEAGPWQDLSHILSVMQSALPEAGTLLFSQTTALQATPPTDDLSNDPAWIPAAVLGLFPTRNLGLLRDTQWMIDQEDGLSHPVKSFLDPRATEALQSVVLPETPEIAAAERAQENRAIADELLVTHADPCQANAVRQARHAPALVIHGPPGTGKSQTIANIIGDHLARGERVLFVCEKRTALDVVKYRLDGLGLGHLCGVIHDPAVDRRGFYLTLRERLDQLASEPPLTNPKRALNAVNRCLTELRSELLGYFRDLHVPGDDGEISFHDAVGEWLGAQAEARAANDGELPMIPAGFTSEELSQHRVSVEESLRRAERLHWPSNPWATHRPASLNAVLGKQQREWQSSLQHLVDLAEPVDAPLSASPLWPQDVALTRETLAPASADLEKAALALQEATLLVDDAILHRYATATSDTLGAWEEQATRMQGEIDSAATTPLNQEWLLTARQEQTSLPMLNERIVALETWSGAQGFGKLFRFLKSGPARTSIAPLGMTLSDTNAQQALAFYRGLKTRITLTHALETTTDWLGDDTLAAHWRARRLLGEALKTLTEKTPAHAWSTPVKQALREGVSGLTGITPPIFAAAERLKHAAAWLENAALANLFSDSCLESWAQRAGSNAPFLPALKGLLAHCGELEDAARFEHSLEEMPESLSKAVRVAAEQTADADGSLPGLRYTALDHDLRTRLAASPNLSALDGDRIESAFISLAELTLEKQSITKRLAAYQWSTRQRSSLLASTHGRLNSAGASLRQRLFIRGKRALKLRQMIAAGADSPEGDPLFDLCPVWMAGPSTVAQILPREPLFDAVIFDEASQCRLEEALPVILRGRRVVIAGDPRQLPPTRFFESAVIESADTDVETVEELFEQRQSDAEDLLTAALNLSVEEAFLDVHYRSHNEALIRFSNEAFYQGRLQAIPGHPKNRALEIPLELRRVDGVYEDRANRREAEAAVDMVAAMLEDKDPPSIGIACFNLPQRDLILDLLEERAEKDGNFANRLAEARSLRRDEAFEGLFVKNLENVQGDERDVMIIATTFGPNSEGKFRRNFGALNRAGGGRRLNVLVTRARKRIIILTSIPRREYVSLPELPEGTDPNGRYYLYAYLSFAETLGIDWEEGHRALEGLRRDTPAHCDILETPAPSRLAQALGGLLLAEHGIGSTVHWGNEGFCLDAALTHPRLPADVTVGLLTDFTRYRRTPDPIAWDLFRTIVFRSQGWELERHWSPSLFRRREHEVQRIVTAHETIAE